MWIYENQNWPEFIWETERLSIQLAEIHRRRGYLTGRMEQFGFDFQREASLCTLTSDVVKSSWIEGIELNTQEVRSSIARRLQIPHADSGHVSQNVEGMVELTLDATQNYMQPLTEERLFGWHALLFPGGFSAFSRIAIGKWRTVDAGPMQVVSGPIGRETVHFEAPHANRVKLEMSEFLDWFENFSSIDPVLKAGIAHLWFVTIHPFEDGNGRIGRAIAELALLRAERVSERYYSLATQLAAEREDYYRQLESQQRGTLDITGWLEWFLGCLARAMDHSETILQSVLHKARLFEKINRAAVSDRQKRVIKRMLDDGFEGYMNTSKYAKLAKCSKDTALRDIRLLKSAGILVQNPGSGRSTSYRLPD